MVAVAILVLGSFCMGVLLLRLLGIRISGVRNVVLSTVLGLACWCHIMFILGHAGFVSSWLIMPILIAPTVLYFARKRTFAPMNLGRAISGLSRFELLSAAVAGAILAIAFISSFAPVAGGIRNDEICTHLSVPADWARLGRTGPLPYAISYMAGNAELLFLAIQAVSPQSGPRLLSWLGLALSGAAVYLITRQHYSKGIAVLAASLAIANPLAFRGASIAFVDTLSTLFILIPVWLLIWYRSSKQTTLIFIAAFIAGTGCGIKPTNYVYIAYAALLWTVAIATENAALASKLKRIVLAAAIVATAASPWPLRTLYYTGSPTYPPPPFLGSEPAKPWNGATVPYDRSEVNSLIEYVNSRYGNYTRSALNAALLPWHITMDPGRFQIGDSIGTVMLSLVPLIIVIIIWRRKKFLALLLSFAALSSGMIYFLILPEARYFMAALIVLSPAFAALAHPSETGRSLSKVVRIVLAVNLLFSLAVAIRIRAATIQTVFSPSARREYCVKNTPFIEAFDYIRANKIGNVVVPGASQIFYYLPGRYTTDPAALENPARYYGRYFLEIDQSQLLERNLPAEEPRFTLQRTPDFLEPVFRGPDAHLYRFTGYGINKEP